MAFVLRSSDGILKNGQKFVGETGPTVSVAQTVSNSMEDRLQGPEPSSTAEDNDEDSNNYSSAEMLPNSEVRIKSENESMQILSAYSLVTSTETEEPEREEDEEHLPDEAGEMGGDADEDAPVEPDSLFEPDSSVALSPSVGPESDEITFEKINSISPDIKPEVDLKIQKKYDPKMGTYYTCPKCSQKYVTEDCVHEHLDYCAGSRASITGLVRNSDPSPDSEESDDSDEDPDFSPADTYQRKVYFPCQLCQRRFDSLNGLRSHERILHGRGLNNSSKPTNADNSKTGPSAVTTAVANMQTIPPVPTKPTGTRIFCGVCNQKFSVKRSLRRHLFNVHLLPADKVFSWLQPENIVTQSAPKVVTEKTDAPPPARQRRSTTTAPPENLFYPCDRCSSDFPSKELLEEHELQHRLDIEKPFSCSFCEKSFFLRSYLEDHEKTHVNEYPYSCSICGECYSRKKDLDEHCSNNPQCATGGGQVKQIDVITCD